MNYTSYEMHDTEKQKYWVQSFQLTDNELKIAITGPTESI